PTWSASVDNGRSILSALKRTLWRLSGICMPNCASSEGWHVQQELVLPGKKLAPRSVDSRKERNRISEA
ncbi:hypothetical protein, partial [Bradyrhizobium sp. CIR3A]|uniref:hypothetical protein n=1 Tax=Bradyrhizobium sp. CIR3A TaxID=2663838 RepID=UPI001AEDF99B